MQYLTRIGLLSLLGLLTLTGGCSKGAKPATTPKQAVINLINSIENNDRNLFMECYDVTKDNYVYFENFFDQMVTMKAFAVAIEKAYGKEALKGLNFGSCVMPSHEEFEKKATVKEEVDTATVELPDFGMTELVRVDGVWKIKFFSKPPSAATLEKALIPMQAITAAMKSVRPNIGKPDVTPETIGQQLKMEIMNRMETADPKTYPRDDFSSQRAKVSAAKTDIANLGVAINAFELDCGRYPTTEEGLPILFTHPTNANNWKGPYLNKSETPRDPWGHPYAYRCPGSHNTNGYDLYWFGPDGQEGGGDDIDNWTKK